MQQSGGREKLLILHNEIRILRKGYVVDECFRVCQRPLVITSDTLRQIVDERIELPIRDGPIDDSIVLGREPVESHRTQDYFQWSRPPTRRESREIAPPPGTTLAPTSGCRIVDSAGVSRPTFSLPLVGCARGTHGSPTGLHAGTCFEITLPTSLVFSWDVVGVQACRPPSLVWRTTGRPRAGAADRLRTWTSTS
jgi:hypothetical protein